MNETKAISLRKDFGLSSFLWRFVSVLVLVVASYNPTQFSYVNWLRGSISASSLGPEHFVVGIVLIIGWSIVVVATQKSLGPVGLLLAAALIGGIVWWLTDINLVAIGSVAVLTWVILVCLSLLLSIGLCWSHLWRRLTGQYEVDDNDT